MSRVIYVLMEGDTILRKSGSSVGTHPALYLTRRAAQQALETGKAWGSYPAHARLVTFRPVGEELAPTYQG